MFDSREHSWKELKIFINGVFAVGARGVRDKTASDDEHVFAAGDKPITIASGNQKPDGDLMLLKSEVDKLNDGAIAAGYNNLTEVRGIDIVCTYAPVGTTKLRTRTYKFVKFTEYEYALKQGDKFMEVTLPFLCLGIEMS